jgi:glycine/D-amino acid oxidase-like deaminating enzyme
MPKPGPIGPTPAASHYDVVIIGGAMMGSAVAWFLNDNPEFDGSVLVVERDPTLEFSSTAMSASCVRHQFSNAINVEISLFGTEYIRTFRDRVGADDPDVPEIKLDAFGYLFLATPSGVGVLRENQAVQAVCGAAAELLEPEEIGARFPFLVPEGIAMASYNGRGEGWFDGFTMMKCWQRAARAAGVDYIANEVVATERQGNRVTGVTLKSGERIACGTVVNASGPRGAQTAAMAGIDIPVEPRKRTTFLFDAQDPPQGLFPLIVDPAGFYVRREGGYFQTATTPDPDPAAAFDDFTPDHAQFEEMIWPALANRISAFETVKVVNAWAGHYAFNTLDQNAIVGRHTEVENFILVNGFSGHGLQQSPAMGRGVAELIAYGGYRSLDLSPLGYDRIAEGRPLFEKAII